VFLLGCLQFVIHKVSSVVDAYSLVVLDRHSGSVF
jgi:hypothetical protein